jgi:AmiR/NasT family two-component response regulator
MRPLNIAVAEGHGAARESLRQLLAGLGHQVVTAEDGRRLAELCRACAPDVVLLGGTLPDRGGVAAAAEVAGSAPVPVILVADRAEEELPAGPETDYVLGHLVRPLRPADVQAALGLALLRFAKFQALRREVAALRQEAADLRQALEDRKVVERAKGAVMRRLGVGEGVAFLRLRQLSSKRGRKLVEVARLVIQAEEVFGELGALGERGPDACHAADATVRGPPSCGRGLAGNASRWRPTGE